MRIAYKPAKFRRATREVIAQANAILAEYAGQGYDLTVRQLYYQFVARGLLTNTERNYKRIVKTVSEARLCGVLDWNSIVDRTRNLRGLSSWSDPQDIIGGAAAGYHLDRWATQRVRVEVWIEKEALSGVFARVCNELDVPFFACRGYVSQSEQWRAAQRVIDRDKPTVVLHFGDHDPSGLDMSRDIRERLELFGAEVEFRRLALNMDQVEEHEPPPNPAKITDSRFAGYLAEHGAESWELDALDPDILAGLVRDAVDEYRDMGEWEEVEEREERERDLLLRVAYEWERVEEVLGAP